MPKSNRPEKFEDVNDYTSDPVMLVQVNIDDGGVPAGLLTKVDELIQIYRGHIGDSLIVSTTGNSLKLARPQNDVEQAATLEQAQKSWDSRNRATIEATKRSKLAVGDELKISGASNCGLIEDKGVPCSLQYGHEGNHFEVVDGKITKITPR